MADFDYLRGKHVSQVGMAIVESLPPGMVAVRLLVEALADGDSISLEMQLVDPVTNQGLYEPSADVTEAVADLYRLFAGAGNPWKGHILTVTRNPKGAWTIEVEFIHEDSGGQMGIDEDALLDDLAPGSLDSLDDLDELAVEEVAEPEFDASAMSSGFQKLLEQNCAMSVEKLAMLDEVTTGMEWEIDLDTRTLRFGDQVSCQVDLMGSVSHLSQTWLWAWDNEAGTFPEAAIAKSKQIQATGGKHDIWEFTRGQIELQRLQPEYLAWVLCGLCQSDFYYWADYDGGSALVVGRCPEVKAKLSGEVPRVTSTLSQTLAIAGEHVDHKKTVLNYLKQKGYRGKQNGAQLQAKSPDGNSLTIAFDQLGRLAEMNGIQAPLGRKRTRADNIQLLKSKGFAPAEWLPLRRFENITDDIIRPKGEMIQRLFCFNAAFQYVCSPPDVVMTEDIHTTISALSLNGVLLEKEHQILQMPREQTDQFRDTIGWTLENMLALCWVLNHQVDLSIDGQMINDGQIHDMLRSFLPPLGSDISNWIATTTLRSENEVIAKEDLFYCCHNAVRSAQFRDPSAVPVGFDPVASGGVIHERRHGLTWALSPTVLWDDTDLST